ncbi:MAG: hypothetical protein IPP01_05460 [Saprospiraceae bacterium]|nr:hypothetical protein [Saprospiraceae bacterium]
MGIVGACDCTDQIACNPNCNGNGGSITVNAFLYHVKFIICGLMDVTEMFVILHSLQVEEINQN